MIMRNEDNKESSVFACEPKFKKGELVTHKRYHYRGVVVEYDLHCCADEEWYQSNQTQPNRNQPWYHVLVHNSSVNTYAAESNLMKDDSLEPIIHPLIEFFFTSFLNGEYRRNDQPWSE